MEQLILDLFESNCIQFGKFTLKSRVVSPIYIDFKGVVGYPNIVKNIVNLFGERMTELNLNYTRLCGVPYGGIVFTSLLSQTTGKPMLIVRKEAKKYGMKKLIEGEYYEGESVVLVEDIISTGKSILEFAVKLTRQKLKITDILVICDRRLHHQNDLNDYKIHSLFTIHDLLTILYKNEKITRETFLEVYSFIIDSSPVKNTRDITFIRENFDTPMKLKISQKIISKKSNICFSYFETDFFKLLDIAGRIGTSIAILIYNSSIITDFNTERANLLKKLANEKNFALFDHLLLGNKTEILEKQLQTAGLIADIVSVSQDYGEANSAIKVVNKKNRINTGIVFNISNELTDNERLQLYNRGNDYPDNLIGFYCNKRSILMNNDLAFYFTDFLNTTDINEPILLRHRNMCDLFTINYKSIQYNTQPGKWIENMRKICWNILNGKNATIE